jgi:hypothetical protein
MFMELLDVGGSKDWNAGEGVVDRWVWGIVQYQVMSTGLQNAIYSQGSEFDDACAARGYGCR